MKLRNFFLVTAIALGLFSCSTDNDMPVMQEEQIAVNTTNDFYLQKILSAGDTEGCVYFLNPSVTVDVSAGIQNPKVIFTADVPNGGSRASSRPYTVTLEMEQLSDCEDLSTGNGIVTRYSLYNQSIPAMLVDPVIKLSRSQLPSTCFRWRFVISGVNTNSQNCVTASAWDYEPLF